MTILTTVNLKPSEYFLVKPLMAIILFKEGIPLRIQHVMARITIAWVRLLVILLFVRLIPQVQFLNSVQTFSVSLTKKLSVDNRKFSMTLTLMLV